MLNKVEDRHLERPQADVLAVTWAVPHKGHIHVGRQVQIIAPQGSDGPTWVERQPAYRQCRCSQRKYPGRSQAGDWQSLPPHPPYLVRGRAGGSSRLGPGGIARVTGAGRRRVWHQGRGLRRSFRGPLSALPAFRTSQGQAIYHTRPYPNSSAIAFCGTSSAGSASGRWKKGLAGTADLARSYSATAGLFACIEEGYQIPCTRGYAS